MRVASCQLNVVFSNPSANADRLIETIYTLRQHEVDIALFPECFLTGYCVDSREEAEAIAVRFESTDSPIARIEEEVNTTGVGVIVGFASLGNDGALRNTAALILPGHETVYYHKVHLPELGFDRFVTPGNVLPVFDTPYGRIGILICFDQRPPEAGRVLALNGADVVFLPTNWPVGAEMSAHNISITRAAENRIFWVTCNRAGKEADFTFIGGSKIIDPTGKVLEFANEEEQILIADLDLAMARQKRTVNVPGKYEYTIFESRHPELYGSLILPNTAE